jgi:hypothetical protein
MKLQQHFTAAGKIKCTAVITSLNTVAVIADALIAQMVAGYNSTSWLMFTLVTSTSLHSLI